MTASLGAVAAAEENGALRLAWHELRTPVFLIREAARLLDAGPPVPGRDGRRALEVILRQADALQRVLDTLAPPEATAAGPATPVAPVLATVAAEVSDLPAARPLDVHVDGSVAVAVPAGALHMVLLNVVANAARYALRGTAVRVRVTEDGDRVVTTVSNASAPIPDVVRDRLFEPYTRYGPPPPSGSAGLGLPIARQVARAHGGDVELTVAGGDPAEVTVAVTLPAR